MYHRSQSVTSLASPFAAAVDLARTGHLPSLPNVPSIGALSGLALPPKPRSAIDRRSATELLPSIHSGVPLALGHLCSTASCHIDLLSVSSATEWHTANS